MQISVLYLILSLKDLNSFQNLNVTDIWFIASAGCDIMLASGLWNIECLIYRIKKTVSIIEVCIQIFKIKSSKGSEYNCGNGMGM